jgi:DNA gyrase/topoisomerase IV subunit B
LKLSFKDEKSGDSATFHNEAGIPAYLEMLVKAEEASRPATSSMFTQKRDNGEKMEVALQWTEGTREDIRSFVNGLPTPQGGTHESGLKAGIAKAVKNYIATHDVKIKGLDITNDDIREGIAAVLSVFVREPMFQSQTKEKLLSADIQPAVDNYVRSGLEAWLNANMSEADKIVFRIIQAARARLASREAVQEIKRKSVTSRRVNLPGKLADCKSTELNETELFIVEGDSAGGSAKQGRNNRTQAVLPLRGKVRNTEGESLSKVLTNTELSDLISAIGTGAGEKFNINGLRYGKIILLMDADADGMHISTLLLAFFFRHMPELIHKGHVFLAAPPLYKIEAGKETHWARDDGHKAKILAGLRTNAKYEVSRFKGLGEMDAKVLAETTLDPRYRTLLKVEIDSLLDTDRSFVDLLGKDPSQRQRFVLDRAATIKAGELDA